MYNGENLLLIESPSITGYARAVAKLLWKKEGLDNYYIMEENGPDRTKQSDRKPFDTKDKRIEILKG